MSKQLTMTIPDVVAAAMDAKGKPFELTGGEWLKQRLMMSVQGCDIPLGLASHVPSGPQPEALEQLELQQASTTGANQTGSCVS